LTECSETSASVCTTGTTYERSANQEYMRPALIQNATLQREVPGEPSLHYRVYLYPWQLSLCFCFFPQRSKEEEGGNHPIGSIQFNLRNQATTFIVFRNPDALIRALSSCTIRDNQHCWRTLFHVLICRYKYLPRLPVVSHICVLDCGRRSIQ